MALSENSMIIIAAIQYFFAVVALALSAALVAKANSVSGEEEVEYSYYGEQGEYVYGVPTWMRFVLFTGAFGFISLPVAFFAHRMGKIDFFIVACIQFMNWVFYLSALGSIANAVSTYSFFCEYIAFGDIYTAYCTIPRATLGIYVLTWLVTSINLGALALNVGGLSVSFFNTAADPHPPPPSSAPPPPTSIPPNKYPDPPNPYSANANDYNTEMDEHKKYAD